MMKKYQRAAVAQSIFLHTDETPRDIGDVSLGKYGGRCKLYYVIEWTGNLVEGKRSRKKVLTDSPMNSPRTPKSKDTRKHKKSTWIIIQNAAIYGIRSLLINGVDVQMLQQKRLQNHPRKSWLQWWIVLLLPPTKVSSTWTQRHLPS